MSRSLYIFHVLFFFTATEAALTHQYSSQHPTLGIRPQLIDKTEQQVTDFDKNKFKFHVSSALALASFFYREQVEACRLTYPS